MLYNQGRLPDPVPEAAVEPARPEPLVAPVDDGSDKELQAFQAAYESPRKPIMIGLTVLGITVGALLIDHVYHEGITQRTLTEWSAEKLSDEKMRRSVMTKIAWFIIRRASAVTR